MQSGLSPQELRRRNRSLVLRHVLRHGAVSRTVLADETGLTGTAITRISRELIDNGLLDESDKLDRGGIPGRRQIQLTLASDGVYVLGLGIQVADRVLVLADLRGDVLCETRLPSAITRDFSGYMDRLADKVDQLISKAGIRRDQIVGMGAAVPGVVDPSIGYVKSAAPLAWQDIPVGQLLSDAMNMPVVVENLNNALSAAEFNFGLGQLCQNIMMFRVSYSVGASFFIEGNLARGHGFAGGLVAHMPVPGGEKTCHCGAKGCLNTVSSGLALLAKYNKTSYAKLAKEDAASNADLLFQMLENANSGDQRAAKILHDAGEQFAQILNIFTLSLQPEKVLLAGQIGRDRNFVAGLTDGLMSESRSESLHADRMDVSEMTVPRAAVYLALSRFVFSEHLDMQGLERNAEFAAKAVPVHVAIQ